MSSSVCADLGIDPTRRQLSETLQRPDAAQLWSTIKIWLHDKPLHFPESPPSTPPLALKASPATPPSFDLGEWLNSPVAVGPDSRPPAKTPTRRSFSNPLARDAQSRMRLSPIILPSDPVKANLDAFSEESDAGPRSKLRDVSPLPPAVQPASDEPTSSDSEEDRNVRLRAIASAGGDRKSVV